MRRFALTVCVLLLIASCGADEPSESAGTTSSSQSAEPTTTTKSETTSQRPTTSAAPAPTTQANVLTLGQTFTNPTTSTKATAFQVIRPAAADAPAPEAPNTEWAAVDVQVCAGPNMPDGAVITGESWKLRDANNGQFGRSSTGYSQFPAPQFPFQEPVGGGECFRGWIVFPVVMGVKLTAVVYAPGQTLPPPFPTWPIP